MAGVVISVKDTVSPMLMAMTRELKDFREPLRLSGMYLQKSFTKQFAAGGKPPWKPLAPSTIKRRRLHSSLPLTDTGRLKRSYTSRVAPGAIYQMEPHVLTMGSNLRYARIHQEGGDVGHTVKGGSRLTARRMGGKGKGQYRFTRDKGQTGKRYRRVSWAGGGTYTVHIPARPLRVQPEDETAIKTIFARWMERQAKVK
jgi:phage gpG-like protein